MQSELNKVTWYSKLGALIVFLIIVPTISFCFGVQYAEIKSMARETVKTISPVALTEKVGINLEIPQGLYTKGEIDPAGNGTLDIFDKEGDPYNGGYRLPHNVMKAQISLHNLNASPENYAEEKTAKSNKIRELEEDPGLAPRFIEKSESTINSQGLTVYKFFGENGQPIYIDILKPGSKKFVAITVWNYNPLLDTLTETVNFNF
jgi:hypothetical protein